MASTTTKRSTTFAIYALALGNFAAGMSTLVMAGVLTEIAAATGVTTGQAGQLISIYSLVYAIATPLIMAFTSRYERRTMLASGLLLVFFGNIAAASATNYFFLFAARIVTALGAAAFVPLAAAVAISLASPEERGRVSAIVFTGFSLATAIGLPIGTFVGLTLGWRFSFALVVLLVFIAMLLIWREVPREVHTPPSNLAILGRVFSNSLIVIVLSVTILQFAGQMALFAYITPWLQEITTLGATGITMMLLVSGFGGVAGNVLAGRTSDRFGAKETQLVLIIALAVVMALLPIMSRSLILGGILVFAWGFVGQGFISPQLVRLVGLNQELSSATLSLNSSFINVGLTLGAATGGVYIDTIGVDTLPWFGVGGVILSIGVFVLSLVMENRQAVSSSQ